MYPPGFALAILTLLVAIAFVAYCLRDLARPDIDVRYFPKSVWAVLCVISVPLGGILYFMFGRVPPL
jgi:hypothetical protein